MKIYNKIHSIFTQLLLVILVAGLCINIAIGMVFHFIYKNLAETPLEKNIIQYVNYLVEDLGTPPQLDRALKIASASRLKIRYEGPGTQWSTAENIPDMDQVHTHIWHEDEGMRIGKYRRHYLVQMTRGPHQVTFDLTGNFRQADTHKKWAVLFVILSTLILAGAYFFMRRILHPLKWLTVGVAQISQGNLDHRVPEKRCDELTELAKAFNVMTGQIKEMLRAKERLMLDVSHELRSPLTRMKVALECMPEGATRDSLREDLAVMESMITEILETARLRGGYAKLNLEKVDMVTMVQSVTADLTGTPPGVEAIDLPTSMPLTVDSELCRTVLENIITNAVKYSGDSRLPVSVSLSQEAPFVTVRVRDHGIGIPQEEIPYIFEPFYRADKSRSQTIKGYGLGLNLCKTIMEALNGDIKVESIPGEGTTVILYFQDTPKV